MYLDHFKLKELPFTITPNVGYFCNLKGHQEAFNTLLFSLRTGEGFIKIVGEVGSGKTLLCRKLLSSLDSHYFSAYIPNPDLNPIELRKALAIELGLESTSLQDQHELLLLINNRLLELHGSGKQVVLLIDEAQALPAASLETLRLLTNLETETTKLLQVVLFGQPELDDRLNQPSFRQLKQRISFSYYLPLMSREDLDSYLFHRLATAGHTLSTLFTKKARDILYQASNGVPRIVNILCHKALMAAYGRGDKNITPKTMRLAVRDTEIALISHKRLLLIIALLSSAVIIVLGFYIRKGII
ncbi:MAG: AAA family ATPase [Pseudomonadota bacterium]